MTIGTGSQDGERGVSVLKRVRRPKITRNSWKSACVKEKEKRCQRREIEVMRLILCFLCFQRTAVSFGYRTVAFFFSFRPLLCRAALLPRAVPASFSIFFSRHNEAFMSWTSALVPLFSSRSSRPYVKCCRTLAGLSTLYGWKLSFVLFLMLDINMKKLFIECILYIHTRYFRSKTAKIKRVI